jgi:molybdate-binding protein
MVKHQQGLRTRVWLDTLLHRASIDPSSIIGSQDEKMTHFEVACVISKGQEEDVELGVETAALSFG